ncbi:MAG TPA: FHA domain-containing protein, partial [Kofleriaceae bacterium]|nr:FHA domain-containing protein [Kofleriaceae bacterium]
MLCEECRDELSSPIKIMPEQIQLHGARPTMAALIDIWGRPHRLDPRTLVGRQVDGQGLAILEPSVSRHHSHLTLDNDQWTVRDLGSANGTFQDDKLIAAPVEVHEGDRIRFGHIAFYFVEDVTRLPPPRLGRTMTATIRPPDTSIVVNEKTFPIEPLTE